MSPQEAARLVGHELGGQDMARRPYTAARLNAWHKNNMQNERFTVGRFLCADGFSISIQASGGHYCSPREDRAWPYTAFELGFPNQTDEALRKYAENKDGNLQDTVFGWVPVDVVVALINRHGGPQ